MLKKIYIALIVLFMHIYTFSAASNSCEVVSGENKKAPSFSLSEPSDKVFERIVQLDERQHAEFTARVGSTQDGIWVFTEEIKQADGQIIYRDEIYKQADSRRKIISQTRWDNGAKVSITKSLGISLSETKHYCCDESLTAEGNRLLQILVDWRCVYIFLETGKPVHRLRAWLQSLSQEQAKREFALLEFKEKLADNQVLPEAYRRIFKLARELARKEMFYSCFPDGYILGKPLERPQRPRSWSV